MGARSGIPFDVPRAWQADLADYAWTAQEIGCSAAAVFRLDARGRPPLFVKIEPAGALEELPSEALRLRWLASQGVACPTIQREAIDSGQNWLLISALAGHDLASSPKLGADQIVEITARALRRLHELDIVSCPFDHGIDRRLEDARARVEAGAVDESDFDAEREGQTARDLFEELLARRPRGEDLVVTHGDACLPNLIADQGRFSGFIDCSRLGVADRHQDLSLAARSIRSNLGDPWGETFLRLYGGPVDPERLAFYQLLDEFF
ncbi:MAG: APH(3') family aminoglycoside O-phosphotransferase [Alphaproteobacteria bacterium 65-37]|nr:MAG: APH(3') family aminoglycoside O-phosphotransferase [Alphaproteobacteria bacterium 65-37]